jgi:hypothetical protein
MSVLSWLKPGTLAAMVVVAGSLLAPAPVQAQAQYQAYPSNQVPAPPPSWSYDPYTSGLAPCPQSSPPDLTRCSEQMPPSNGQPNYWSTR